MSARGRPSEGIKGKEVEGRPSHKSEEATGNVGVGVRGRRNKETEGMLRLRFVASEARWKICSSKYRAVENNCHLLLC